MNQLMLQNLSQLIQKLWFMILICRKWKIFGLKPKNQSYKVGEYRENRIRSRTFLASSYGPLLFMHSGLKSEKGCIWKRLTAVCLEKAKFKINFDGELQISVRQTVIICHIFAHFYPTLWKKDNKNYFICLYFLPNSWYDFLFQYP